MNRHICPYCNLEALPPYSYHECKDDCCDEIKKKYPMITEKEIQERLDKCKSKMWNGKNNIGNNVY